MPRQKGHGAHCENRDQCANNENVHRHPLPAGCIGDRIRKESILEDQKIPAGAYSIAKYGSTPVTGGVERRLHDSASTIKSECLIEEKPSKVPAHEITHRYSIKGSAIAPYPGTVYG